MLSAHSSIIYIMTVSHVSLHSFSEKCTPCNIILYLNAHCLYSVRVRSCSHWLSIDLAQMWVVNMDRGRGRVGRGMEGNIPFHTRNKVWKWHFSCSYKDHRYKCEQGKLHQPHWGQPLGATSSGCWLSHLLAPWPCSTINCCVLTRWCPLLPHGYRYKASCARPG